MNLLVRSDEEARPGLEGEAEMRTRIVRIAVVAALGSLLYRQHRWEEALRHLTEALRLRPDLADARFHMAAIYWQQGRYAEAAEQRAALARLRPDLASRLPTP